MFMNLSIILLLALTTRAALAVCPRLCECKWRSGKESAVCARTGLRALPVPLEAGTQLLDLTGNRLNSLPEDVFSNAGLLNLQRIYLSDCDLRVLRKNTFRGLVNLVELDLSENRIESVPSQVLFAASEIRDLRLDKNPISKILDNAFRFLIHLVRLDLSGCKIFEIQTKAFYGLDNSLEFLKLDDNRIKTLKAVALAPLKTLRGIELAGNLWECSCELRPLREWMLSNNVPATVSPECSSPPRIALKPWERLDLDDFACPPQVRPAEAHTSGYEGEEITLACKVSGVPTPHVKWLRSGKPIINSTGTPAAGLMRFDMLRGEGTLSNLIIHVAELQDAGPYRCAAENRAGKAEASVTLVVERHSPRVMRMKFLLFASFSAGILVVSSCIGAFFIRESKRKRNALWNEQIVSQARREDNYEKIETNNLNILLNSGSSNNSSSCAQINTSKKCGDYRNVPSNDTEDEREGYDDNFCIKDIPSKPSIFPLPITISPTENLSRVLEHWQLADEPDLHIPRLADLPRTDSTPDSAPSSTSTAVAGANFYCEDRSNNNPSSFQNIIRPRTFIPACERLDNDLLARDSEKNYPDLLEMSQISMIMRKQETGPPPPYYQFCTLPRKKISGTDSRSPLLSDSRYGSSGGESSIAENSERRSSVEIHKPTQKNSRRSNSTVNLSGEMISNRRYPSLPGTPEPPSATPLLDISGLRQLPRSTDAYLDTEQYDHHASQLERFLEEYRTLREQLTKMKESREKNKTSRFIESGESYRTKPSVAVTAASSAVTLPDPNARMTLPSSTYHKEWLSRCGHTLDPFCS